MPGHPHPSCCTLICSQAPCSPPFPQPRYSIFRLFDDVLLLGKGGCVKLAAAGLAAVHAGASSGPAAWPLHVYSSPPDSPGSVSSRPCRRRMVYLGPSRLALPYFETIGFALPPNENPAGGLVLARRCASPVHLHGTATPLARLLITPARSIHFTTHAVPHSSTPRLCHGRDCWLGATCRRRPLPALRPQHPVAVPWPRLGATALQAGGQGCAACCPDQSRDALQCH